MRKIIFTIILFVFSLLQCFAEYNPIPKDRQQEYKLEMERIINNEIPRLKQEVDNVVMDAKAFHDELIKNGYDFDNYMNLLLCSEVSIWSFDGELENEMIKYTQQYFFAQTYKPTTIADFEEYRTYLYQNIKETNVDTSGIKELIKYQKVNDKKIKKYIRNIQKNVLQGTMYYLMYSDAKCTNTKNRAVELMELHFFLTT